MNQDPYTDEEKDAFVEKMYAIKDKVLQALSTETNSTDVATGLVLAAVDHMARVQNKSMREIMVAVSTAYFIVANDVIDEIREAKKEGV